MNFISTVNNLLLSIHIHIENITYFNKHRNAQRVKRKNYIVHTTIQHIAAHYPLSPKCHIIKLVHFHIIIFSTHPPKLSGFLLPLTRFYNVNIPHGKEKEKNPHQPPGHPPYRLRNSCRNRLLLPSVSTVSSGPHRLRIHRPRRHSRLHI